MSTTRVTGDLVVVELGKGGPTVVARAAGMSRNTVHAGAKAVDAGEMSPLRRALKSTRELARPLDRRLGALARVSSRGGQNSLRATSTALGGPPARKCLVRGVRAGVEHGVAGDSKLNPGRGTYTSAGL